MDLELDQFKDVNLVIDKANNIFIPRQFVSQGDYKGRTLTVQITNNGSIGELPGLTLNLNWHNEASGLTDLTAFTILDKTNSIFRIEYPENMMTPGKVYASIQIIQDGKVTNLKQFELVVQELAGQPVGIAEKAEFSALVAVLADSNKFRTDIDSLSASKADKNYINDYLSKVTVVPETFTNLAAIQAKYPSGKNGLMVAADNGHKYIWANNVWTDAGVYQAAGIANGSIVSTLLANKAVIPAKTSFISPSNNLLIDANWNMGYFVPATFGVPQTYKEDDRFASQIVKVGPGEYCIGYTNYLTTIFDENLALIRSVGNDAAQDKNLVITIAEGESYVGISVLKERLQAPFKTWMVKGNTPPEEITPDKINANISFENVTDTDQLSENIDKKIIYPVWNEHEHEFDSELIPISPNSYFSVNNGYAGMKGAAGLVPYKEYNADKVLILSHDFQDAGAVVPDFIKTSEKTAYIQLSVYKNVRMMIYDSESIKHIFLVMGRRDTLKDVSPDDDSLFGQSTLRNLYKYPDYPVWGYEYMHGYYAKVFQSQ